MLIVNGRTTGDIFGKYTCHKWNGSSVVDYFLSPNHFCNRISNFSVGKYIPWLSDHCIIKVDILLNDNLDRKTSSNMEAIKVHPGFLWNESSKFEYQNALQSSSVTNKINVLLRSSNMKALDLAAEIKNILLDNAKTSGLKQKKVPLKEQRQSDPWFDAECKNAKKNFKFTK